MNYTIDTPAEYALYWLALNHPAVIAEAERTRGTAMLANDQAALRSVKALAACGRHMGDPCPECVAS